MSRGTLASQIQARVAVTVAALAVILAIMTLVVANSLLIRQLDSEIENIPLRAQSAQTGVQSPGIPVGTVLVLSGPGGTYAGVVRGDEVHEFSKDASNLLRLPPGRHTVAMQDLGKYRLLVDQSPQGKMVIGLPMQGVEQMMFGLGLSALWISVVAVVVTVLVTRTLISRATRPLATLTKTAETVSEMPLERGTVEVPRVQVGELPPGHEVAKVGSAFNHMLDNVEGALVSRESSEQKLRRFVADASHELRNPLAAIHGYAQLLNKHGTGFDDNASFALGRIESESERMTKLVRDLLTLARLDADRVPELERVDVVEVVLNAASDMRTTSPEHVWRVNLPDEPVEVMADADALHQVMLNLLGNARNHTPVGTIVETEVLTNGTIVVTDNGPGIPAEIQEHVFERFMRADDARRHTSEHSTGLGLAIVAAHVTAFGGTVELESEPGRTRFTVRLPLAS